MVASQQQAPARGRYSNGQPYRIARGRHAPRTRLEDTGWVAPSIVSGYPTSQQFLRAVVDEMRLRCYRPNTLSTYASALRRFLRWFGQPPHRATSNDVREYLLFLIDAGRDGSSVSGNLSALRTAFDKFCGRDVTFGLVTPRRPKRLPVVLSEPEVRRLLDAAPRLRDKLVLGLMYASGLRVSEVCRLQWRDLDFDREVIRVRQAKGQRDRQVILPNLFRELLARIGSQLQPGDFLFPGQNAGRHLSPRTAQRIMQRAVRAAGIAKRATPHSLRHTFATHAFEQGCDIRRLQKLLGHVHLDTTTIYVKVARPCDSRQMTSPLDRLSAPSPTPDSRRPSIGRLKIHLHPEPSVDGLRQAQASLLIDDGRSPVELTGIRLREARRGWVTIELPQLDAWDPCLRRLPAAHRERIEEPAFFELLQRELPRRLLAQVPG